MIRKGTGSQQQQQQQEKEQQEQQQYNRMNDPQKTRY